MKCKCIKWEIARNPKHGGGMSRSDAGIYVINSGVLDSIPRNQRVDMTDILSEQISQDRSVHMFPIHEYWLDIGKFEEFEKANTEYKRFF